MKMFLKIDRRSAMTRVEILMVVGVLLIAAYCLVRYQKTGEVFQISWRKTAEKTNSVVETEPSTAAIDTEIVNDPEVVDTTVKVQPTNIAIAKSVSGKGAAAEVAATRLDEWRKQKVAVPTNAVWSTNQTRKKPGVRIAFP